MLSKYTKDNKYRTLAEKSALRIAKNNLPLPGLPAQGLDPATGNPLGAYVVRRPQLSMKHDGYLTVYYRHGVAVRTATLNTLSSILGLTAVSTQHLRIRGERPSCLR